MPKDNSQATTLVQRLSNLTALWEDPRVRSPVEFIGFIATLLFIYEMFGGTKTLISGVIVLLYYAIKGYRSHRLLQSAHRVLLAELPNHHAFLVEFLRETYSLPKDEVLVSRNIGLLVHSYENNFVVNGTDCANEQRIQGKNVGTTPSRGLAFALVGGSSLNSKDLDSKYSIGDSAGRAPEFIVDRDRFKIAFCAFDRPLGNLESFDLSYTDKWNGAMRREADGFFFPEALFFPGGIHRLSSRISFYGQVRSIAVLAVNTTEGTIATCESQPRSMPTDASGRSVFKWELDSPPPNMIYVMYYSMIC